jgi:hypothetical protein
MLLYIVSGLLDEGGAHEHDPGTLIEIALNTLCCIALLPMFAAARFIGDGDGIFSFLAIPLIFALNAAVWGCLFEIVPAGIKVLKRKLSGPVPKV